MTSWLKSGMSSSVFVLGLWSMDAKPIPPFLCRWHSFSYSRSSDSQDSRLGRRSHPVTDSPGIQVIPFCPSQRPLASCKLVLLFSVLAQYGKPGVYRSGTHTRRDPLLHQHPRISFADGRLNSGGNSGLAR